MGNTYRRGEKTDTGKKVTTRDLTRIITILQENKKPLIKKDFKKYINDTCLKDAIVWLVNNKIVLSNQVRIKVYKNHNSYDRTTKSYSINPKFLELKK
jgi:hypothetical protein